MYRNTGTLGILIFLCTPAFDVSAGSSFLSRAHCIARLGMRVNSILRVRPRELHGEIAPPQRLTTENEGPQIRNMRYAQESGGNPFDQKPPLPAFAQSYALCNHIPIIRRVYCSIGELLGEHSLAGQGLSSRSQSSAGSKQRQFQEYSARKKQRLEVVRGAPMYLSVSFPDSERFHPSQSPTSDDPCLARTAIARRAGRAR